MIAHPCYSLTTLIIPDNKFYGAYDSRRRSEHRIIDCNLWLEKYLPFPQFFHLLNEF